MKLLRFLKKILGLKRSATPPPDQGLNSLVWLLREPRRVNEETVLILARKILGDDLITVAQLPRNPDLPGDMFMVAAKPRRAFGVIFAARPYVDDVAAAAADIPEKRRSRLFAEHTAWLAVDIMESRPSPEAWEVVARLAAELAGPDCLMMYVPSQGRAELYSEDLLEALRKPDPLEAFTRSSEPPVVSIDADTEELKQAEEEARERWPEFVAAFTTRNPAHEDFAVKAPFDTADGDVEHMWVMVQEVAGDTVKGLLGNDPVNVPELSAGCPVELHRDRISDWCYIDEGEMVGGFSMKVLMRGQQS